MSSHTENQDFIDYRDNGSVHALTRVFDRVAPQLLLLAMHVTPDSSQAEDLVQSTFLQAMKEARHYDGVRPVSGWLSGILKNQAVNLLRRNRLRKNEALPEDLRGGPDPATIVADQDLWDRVADGIQRLSNPYREVLALRIVNGLEPSAIAHSLGRSPSTVRMQLKRGLEQLRRALPTDLGCLGAWVLIPTKGLQVIKQELVTQAGDAACAKSGGESTTGFVWPVPKGTVATVKLLGILLVATLGLIAYRSLTTDSTLVSNPAISPTESALSKTQGTEDTELLSLTVDAKKRHEAPGTTGQKDLAAQSTNLDIRVTYEADDSPAIDVGIYIRSIRGKSFGIEARTNEQGIVSFPDLDPDWYSLNVDRLQSAIRFESSAQELFEVRIPPGVVVQGQVTDLENNPVPGATIYRINEHHHDVMQAVAVADEAGRFSLKYAENRTEYLARAKGWQPSEVRRFSTNTVLGFHLQMGARGNSLTGTVVDEDNQPVPFAWVAIGTDEDSRESIDGTLQAPGDAKRSKVMDLEGILLRADASGRFESHEVPSGFVLVVAREAGENNTLVGTSHYWQGRGLDETVEVVLYPGAQIFGVIKDVTGQPIPNLRIEVEWEGRPELGQFEHELGPFVSDRFVVTNELGEYTVEGLLAGDVDLRLIGQGRWLRRAETILTSGQHFRWDPVIDEVTTLEVHLTDERGGNLEGWSIKASSRRIDNNRTSGDVSTNANGKRTLMHLDPNQLYDLRLHAPLPNRSFPRKPTAIRTDINGNQSTLHIVLTDDELSGKTEPGQ